MIQLLYPSSPLRARKPDEQYAEEVEAVQEAGFEVSVFSLEKFQDGEFQMVPPIGGGGKVLYRGWMLSLAEYSRLVDTLRKEGVTALVSAEEYGANHYLPNWYSKIAEFTPETRIYPTDADLAAELTKLGWEGYFIKDYVKSLKTSVGSKITTPEQAAVVAAEMQKFRGKIEGGFCVRRVEEFLAESERRYFVIEGKAHAAEGDVPEIVHQCAKRLTQRFYSIDVIRRADGEMRVVEIGDGQVSDLVSWEPRRFAGVMKEHFLKTGRR